MFASGWARKEIAETMSHDNENMDAALLELCWHLESCDEAIEVIQEFDECPVCLRRIDDDGVLRHKHPSMLKN